MQHSQIRGKAEILKIFSHKDPLTVQKTLSVFKYDSQGNYADITPQFSVEDLNTGYYKTSIVTPNEDCYLNIIFCGSPMVVRVGDPALQFMFFTDQAIDVPFIHYDEFGTELATGSLTELLNGFYHYTPADVQLGYIEIYGRPNVLNIPYCSKDIGVAIDIEWAKKVIKREFGVTTIIREFSLKRTTQVFDVITKKQEFDRTVQLRTFDRAVIKQEFEIKCIRG